MSTELMTATNSGGTIEVTGYHRKEQRRYQITISTNDESAYIDVDAETIANMQRCVDKYRELYPNSED